jgi:predicted esterase
LDSRRVDHGGSLYQGVRTGRIVRVVGHYGPRHDPSKNEILENAATLGVGSNGYSLWGSSAGARMAAAIGSHGVSSYGGADGPKPSAVVMAYTAHSDYASAEPDTFVVVGEKDGIAHPGTMKRRVEALRASGTKVEYREYKGLGHGFGLGTGTSAEGWVFEAIRFWERSIGRSPSTP